MSAKYFEKITSLTSAADAAAESCRSFRQEHQAVIDRLAALEAATREAWHHVEKEAQGVIPCAFLEGGGCSRGFLVDSLEEVEIPDEFRGLDFGDAPGTGTSSARRGNGIPEGWFAPCHTCGCGRVGAVYCPGHAPEPDAPEERNLCASCAR